VGGKPVFLKTERLLIRNFEENDWKAVHEYTSDYNVMKYIPEGVLSEENTKEFVNKNLSGDPEQFAVILIEENTLIGHIAFHKYFGDHTYEIGWVFNSKYYNKGYASEAAKAVLKYGFEDLNLHRIIATFSPRILHLTA
jgi:[ribosomal protein S5]-alanine N-acetyltransferase